MVDKFKVTIHSYKERTFIAHINTHNIKFRQFNNRLYGLEPTQQSNFFNTMNRI